MQIISLIACSKTKKKYTCMASKMYCGNLFCKAYQYCLLNNYQIYILSAKYGLLLPSQNIDPYNLTLNNMTIDQRKEWSKKVISSIKNKRFYYKKIIVFAGKKYHEFLNLPNADYPLSGITQGKQLQWFNNRLKSKQKQRSYFLQ